MHFGISLLCLLTDPFLFQTIALQPSCFSLALSLRIGGALGCQPLLLLSYFGVPPITLCLLLRLLRTRLFLTLALSLRRHLPLTFGFQLPSLLLTEALGLSFACDLFLLFSKLLLTLLLHLLLPKLLAICLFLLCLFCLLLTQAFLSSKFRLVSELLLLWWVVTQRWRLL
jgi:hypothetical protein